jgi:RimJ/RimL family protein N-acetyltransferase
VSASNSSTISWDPALIGFRPLFCSDLAILQRWMQAPHVHRWWHPDSDFADEELVANYSARIRGEDPTRSFVILYEPIPIGYVQTYPAWSYPEWVTLVAPDQNAAGCDILIGERDYVYRGLGVHILKKFLRKIVIVDPDIESCIIDPEPANLGAIRAYEKVGFRHVQIVQSSLGKVYR